ncbi:hypothetical protein [Nitrosomonas sp.]|uniref:hypothetical protein n=1 Tax=Nitrosomonas sp. TaxID=42353 RepID=UPI0032EB96B0
MAEPAPGVTVRYCENFLHAAGNRTISGKKRCKPLAVDTRPVLMSARKNEWRDKNTVNP